MSKVDNIGIYLQQLLKIVLCLIVFYVKGFR